MPVPFEEVCLRVQGERHQPPARPRRNSQLARRSLPQAGTHVSGAGAPDHSIGTFPRALLVCGLKGHTALCVVVVHRVGTGYLVYASPRSTANFICSMVCSCGFVQYLIGARSRTCAAPSGLDHDCCSLSLSRDSMSKFPPISHPPSTFRA